MNNSLVVENTLSDENELEMLKAGPDGVATLYTKYSEQFMRMVAFRLDRRLYGRVDPSDVLQDAYLEVAKRIDEYLASQEVSFFVWARQLTWQTLLKTNRRHLETQKRDAKREVRIDMPDAASCTSVALAAKLIANVNTPSKDAIRGETLQQLLEALNTMDPIDREVLALRHFEQLTNNEVAEVLDLKKSAASNRYVRALGRLKEIMESVLNNG